MKTIRNDTTVKPLTVGSTVHAFEVSGLGKAPFKFVRMTEKVYQACHGAPVQPGSSCDFCGTAIRYEFWIKSSDQKEFKVGCDCVEKTNDLGLRRVVDGVMADFKRTQLRIKNDAKVEEIKSLLAKVDVQARLKSLPHPHAGMASEGKTLLDYASWMMRNAGMAGTLKLGGIVKKAMQQG